MKSAVKYAAVFAMVLMLGKSVAAQDAGFSENGINFPLLTLDQLISYYEMDSVSFDMIMKDNGFLPTGDIYCKGDLKTSKMVFGKTRNFGVSVAWISKTESNSLIAKLLEKTAGTEKVSPEDGFYFLYKKYIITIKSTKSSHYIEEINITDKNGVKQNQGI